MQNVISSAEDFIYDNPGAKTEPAPSGPPAQGFGQRVRAVRVRTSRLVKAAWYERDYTSYRFEASLGEPGAGEKVLIDLSRLRILALNCGFSVVRERCIRATHIRLCFVSPFAIRTPAGGDSMGVGAQGERISSERRWSEVARFHEIFVAPVMSLDLPVLVRKLRPTDPPSRRRERLTASPRRSWPRTATQAPTWGRTT
eukprot:SAG11_NODE_2893_length_2860_cov_8.281420_3_plen_199_part_00